MASGRNTTSSWSVRPTRACRRSINYAEEQPDPEYKPKNDFELESDDEISDDHESSSNHTADSEDEMNNDYDPSSTSDSDSEDEAENDNKPVTTPVRKRSYASKSNYEVHSEEDSETDDEPVVVSNRKRSYSQTISPTPSRHDSLMSDDSQRQIKKPRRMIRSPSPPDEPWIPLTLSAYDADYDSESGEEEEEEEEEDGDGMNVPKTGSSSEYPYVQYVPYMSIMDPRHPSCFKNFRSCMEHLPADHYGESEAEDKQISDDESEYLGEDSDDSGDYTEDE